MRIKCQTAPQVTGPLKIQEYKSDYSPTQLSMPAHRLSADAGPSYNRDLRLSILFVNPISQRQEIV